MGVPPGPHSFAMLAKASSRLSSREQRAKSRSTHSLKRRRLRVRRMPICARKLASRAARDAAYASQRQRALRDAVKSRRGGYAAFGGLGCGVPKAFAAGRRFANEGAFALAKEVPSRSTR